MSDLSLQYPEVLSLLHTHLAAGRTESRSFLAWFLETYYRLEQVEAQDAVCDGPDDKGVDGLYVDANLERVDVLQSKLFQNSSKTLGDSSLKEFWGTMEQFRHPASINAIASSTSNAELRALISETKVAELVRDGYEVRGIFVTNAGADANAQAFIDKTPNLILYDRAALQAAYIATGPEIPVSAPFTFDISGFDVIEYKTLDATAVFAPLLATDLVRLEGIENGSLFA